MPRAANSTGPIRGKSAAVCSMGLDHQVTAAQSRGGHGGQAGETEFDGQPAGAGDALVPNQPVRAGLALTGDERCSPEQPDKDGLDQHGGGDAEEGVLVVPEEPVDEVRAAAALGGAGGDPGGVVVGGHLGMITPIAIASTTSTAAEPRHSQGRVRQRYGRQPPTGGAGQLGHHCDGHTTIVQHPRFPASARLFRRGGGGSSRSSTRPGPGRERRRSRSRSTGRPSSGRRAGR
jgi:hypothetical protein